MAKMDDLHVDLSLRGYEQSMGGLSKFQGAINGLKTSMMLNYGGVLGGGGFAGLAKLSTIKIAADLEQSRLSLKRFVDTDFDPLVAGIDKLSSRLGVPIHDLYEIAAGAAQVGVEGSANILAFTETVGKLATISNMSADSVGKDVAKIFNVFKLAPKEAEAFGSMLADLSKASAGDPGELITLVQRMGGVSQTIGKGMKVQEVSALAAGIKDAGLPSELAGTAFNALFISMAKETEKWADGLKMSTEQFKTLRDNDPFKAMIMALTAIKDEATTDDRIAMAEQFGITMARENQVHLGMITVVDKLKSHLERANKAYEQHTEITKQSAIQEEGTWKTLTRLANTFTVAAGKIEDSSLNFVKIMAGGLNASMQKAMGDPEQLGLFHWFDEVRKRLNRPLDDLQKDMDARAIRDRTREGIDLRHPANVKAYDAGTPERRKEILAAFAPEKLAKQAAEEKRRADAAAADAALAPQRKARQEAADERDLAKRIEQEALGEVGEAKNWWRGRQAAGLAVGKPEDHPEILKAAENLNAARQRLAEAENKLAEAEEAALPDAERKAGQMVRGAAREIRIDALMNQQRTDAMDDELRSGATFKMFGGADAFKGIEKVWAEARKGAPIQMKQDEIMAFAAQQVGAKQNVIDQVVQEKMGRFRMKPQFGDAESMHKRIQSGALEDGDIMTRILKENQQAVKFAKEAADELKEIKTEIQGNLLVIAGG